MILVFGHNLISHNYSPIHNHGNANAVIKVLHGSIRIKVYNKHTKDFKAEPIKQIDLRTDDVTWIDRNWYQTHPSVSML
jgi:hypothetical protein